MPAFSRELPWGRGAPIPAFGIPVLSGKPYATADRPAEVEAAPTCAGPSEQRQELTCQVADGCSRSLVTGHQVGGGSRAARSGGGPGALGTTVVARTAMRRRLHADRAAGQAPKASAELQYEAGRSTVMSTGHLTGPPALGVEYRIAGWPR